MGVVIGDHEADASAPPWNRNVTEKIVSTPSSQRSWWRRGALLSFAAAALATPLAAADFTARDITLQFHKAEANVRVDFSGKDLANLDLAGLDFKSANLAKTNLYGTDLSSANLKGTDLSGARLDRAIVARADFSGANLEGASVLRPSIYTSLDYNPSETPKFANANLKGATLIARLDGADFSGANLEGATIGPSNAADDTLVTRSSRMIAPNFTGANLSGAVFRFVDFSYGRFSGANLAGASLAQANLAKADFSGADLTGADLSGSNLDGARFTGAKGFESVKGLASVRNLDKAIRE